MKLVCPACGEFIQGNDIDLGKSLAVCRPCGEIVGLPAVVHLDEQDRVVGEGSALFTAREITSLPLYAYRPRGLLCAERREGRGTTVSVREDRGTAVIYVIAALMWNVCLSMWISILRWQESSVLGPLRYFFPLLHVSVGLYLLYGCVCLFINQARLSLSPTRFACHIGPLPFHPSCSEPLSNIRAFVDSQYVVTRLPDRWFRQNIAWTVTVLLRDHRSIELPLYLAERDHARYLALRLNRALDELRAGAPRQGTVLALGEDGPPG